jgi:hypothetical protein
MFNSENLAETVFCSLTCLIILCFIFPHRKIIRPPLPFTVIFFFLIPRFIYFILELIFSNFSFTFWTPLILILQSFNFYFAFYLVTFYFDGIEKNKKEWIQKIKTYVLSKYYLHFLTLPIILILL